MQQAIGVYSESDDPSPLPGVKRLYTTGDVAHMAGCSPRWIVDEIHAGHIVPAACWIKRRSGQWEPFSLFEEAEVERYLRSRSRPSRAPYQLSLRLEIPGGRR